MLNKHRRYFYSTVIAMPQENCVVIDQTNYVPLGHVERLLTFVIRVYEYLAYFDIRIAPFENFYRANLVSTVTNRVLTLVCFSCTICIIQSYIF